MRFLSFDADSHSTVDTKKSCTKMNYVPLCVTRKDRCYPKLICRLSFFIIHSVTYTSFRNWITLHMTATFEFRLCPHAMGYSQHVSTSNRSPFLCFIVQVVTWTPRLVAGIGAISISFCINADGLCILFWVHNKAIQLAGSFLAH